MNTPLWERMQLVYRYRPLAESDGCILNSLGEKVVTLVEGVPTIDRYAQIVPLYYDDKKGEHAADWLEQCIQFYWGMSPDMVSLAARLNGQWLDMVELYHVVLANQRGRRGGVRFE